MKTSNHFAFLQTGKTILILVCLFVQTTSVGANTCSKQCEQAKVFYFSGDLDKASRVFLSLADSGEAESLYYLGLIYLDENWTGHNKTKAVAYLHTAADQSHAASMWKLGELHETGNVVEKDLLRATDWYRKSASIADRGTQIHFVEINNGDVKEEPTNSVIVKTLELARQNDIDAQIRLAKIYDTGILTEKDYHMAFYWYLQAAKQGNTYAMFMTGYLYCRGVGVEFNEVQASYWLDKSGREATCKN
jgi:TPR repeat protein